MGGEEIEINDLPGQIQDLWDEEKYIFLIPWINTRKSIYMHRMPSYLSLLFNGSFSIIQIFHTDVLHLHMNLCFFYVIDILVWSQGLNLPAFCDRFYAGLPLLCTIRSFFLLFLKML